MTSGEQIWDMIFIDDVIDAIVKTLNSQVGSGEILNIGAGKGYKLRDVGEMIVNLTGNKIALRIGELSTGKGDIPNLVCKTEKALALTGWQSVTSLTTGMRKTIDWYAENLEQVKMNS